MRSKEDTNTGNRNYIKLTIFGLFLIIFAAILYLISPNLVERKYRSELQLKNGSQMYTTWTSNETKSSLKVYFFEVLNARDVVNGKQGVVQEIGPYHFDIMREKRITDYWSNEDTLQFEEYKSYHFNEDLSVGTLNDKISVVNVPIVALSASLTNFVNRFPLSIVTRPILSAVLQGILQVHQQYFVTRQTVRQLMFSGYRVNVFDTIVALSAPLRIIGIRLPMPKLVNNSFGLYYGRNGSIEGPFKVFTGVTDPIQTAKITSWKGKSSLNYWNHASCNSINGTYGTQFPPFIKKTDRLFVFLPEICRSVSLIYQNESNVNSVKTYRFVISGDAFKSSNYNADNWCFCSNNQSQKTCEFDGTIDVSVCKRGAPILASNPHYLYGSAELRSIVNGLKPDADKHLTYYDIEPISGAVLRSQKRFGISVYVQRFPTLNILRRSLKNTVLPLAWIEESMEINEKESEEFQVLFQPVKVTEVAVNSLFLSGISLIVITIFLHCCCRRKSKNVPENEKKVISEPAKIENTEKEVTCCSSMFSKPKKDNKIIETKTKKPKSAGVENRIRPVMDLLFPQSEPEKFVNKPVTNEIDANDLDEYWDEFSVNSRDFDKHSIITTIQKNVESTKAVPPIESNDQLQANKTHMNGDIQTGSLAISKRILNESSKLPNNPLRKHKSSESIAERRSLNGIDYRGITVAEAIDILNDKFGQK